jgi:Mg2+-importing ATPase
MSPSQILLNNLLYDSSQMAIPTDNVDEELVARPAHWDIHFIQRFMIMFGPVSSLFDFLTFGLMIGVFHAHEHLFQSGWFVESLATQTLVVFAIRTRRIPFWTSKPSGPLLVAVITVVGIGAYLPYSPFSHALGFEPLPVKFFFALAGMVVAYLVLVETMKRYFYRSITPAVRPPRTMQAQHRDRVLRRAARWSRPRLDQRPGGEVSATVA